MDTIQDSETLKSCTGCEEEQPISNFHINRAMKDGRSSRCKRCVAEQQKTKYWADPETARARNVASRKKLEQKRGYTSYTAARHRLKTYGLTQEDVNSLRDSQDDLCGICGCIMPEAIDHNHETGKIRGMLCHLCNRGLGHFKDDPLLMESAIEWLRRGI